MVSYAARISHRLSLTALDHSGHRVTPGWGRTGFKEAKATGASQHGKAQLARQRSSNSKSDQQRHPADGQLPDPKASLRCPEHRSLTQTNYNGEKVSVLQCDQTTLPTPKTHFPIGHIIRPSTWGHQGSLGISTLNLIAPRRGDQAGTHQFWLVSKKLHQLLVPPVPQPW